MTGRPRSCGSATVLPSARRSSASAAGAAPWSAIRFSPARRSSMGAPATGVVARRTSASAAVRLERIARNRTTWGPCRGPHDARVIEERHGSAGARRALGYVGPMSGPPRRTRDRGAPRLRGGATGVGGGGGPWGAPDDAGVMGGRGGGRGGRRVGGGEGPCGGPHDARVIEERHGSAGARRALGVWGPCRGPHY